VERRLAAILAADMVAYSRLMEADEEGTFSRLKIYRREIYGLIKSHKGRAFGTAGDSVIAEFASPVQALRCAGKIQDDLKERNRDLPEDQRMRFRIGVNLGDVVVEGGELHGDSVAVAARLEALADPGGICISGPLFDQVEGKLDSVFDDLGTHKVKNIAKPVRVYRVRPIQATGEGDRGETVPLALPDKPSIAVLPFANMSGDPEQEYFSDGITEDIITELSRFRDLFVIARNSSFYYKGKAVKVQEVASDLGVRYVLEGSVQAADSRVRISTQLVDADTGHHIWVERYNRELVDIFALQDEISQMVAATAAGRLKLKAEDRAARKPIENLESYDYVLRGQAIFGDTEEKNLRAREAYEKAIELDPTCARAYVGLATCHVLDWISGSGDSLNEALDCATKAVSLDCADCSAHWRLGRILALRGEFEEAKVHLERALELNPNDADALAFMGSLLSQTGNHDEAIDCHRKAMRLNPYHSGLHLWLLGIAYYDAKRYAEALIPVKEFSGRSPKLMDARLLLAATYAQLGRIEEARTVVEEILASHPDFSLRQERESSLRYYKFSHGLEHWLEGLRKAGLPE
jgi:adenylate cyclase